MSLSHPSQELFERFAGGELTADERRLVVEHLLAGCERCRDLAARYWPSSLPVAEAAASRLGGRIWARLQERELRAVREREQAEELLASILNDSPARRHTQVVNRRRYHTWAFCRCLQDQSIVRIFADPHDALALAELALEVAQLIPPADATPALLADLKARVWARIANARRVLGDFPGAEAALAEARMWLARGTGDPMEEADVLELEGSLRTAQRRFEQAEGALRRAIRLHSRIGDRHAEGKVLVVLAVMKNTCGEPRQSIDLLQQALGLIDAARDPRLAINARHNLAVALASVGEPQEALQHIAALRALYDPTRDRVSLLRLRHLESRVRNAMGDHATALEGLDEVRRQFMDLAMPLEVALTALEMATIQVELGMLDAAQRLASETMAISRSLGIQREALAALLVIEEAAQRKALTQQLIKEVLTFLQQSKQNPELKFRG